VVDRRQWLRVGGISLGALVSGPEPSLARLFAAEEATAPRRRPLDREFSVILFWANGGPSHPDTFDLKPGAPAEVRGPFRPIRTRVPGIHISEHLPRLARAVLHSLYSPSNSFVPRPKPLRRASHVRIQSRGCCAGKP
jgi:hypothetical protein